MTQATARHAAANDNAVNIELQPMPPVYDNLERNDAVQNVGKLTEDEGIRYYLLPVFSGAMGLAGIVISSQMACLHEDSVQRFMNLLWTVSPLAVVFLLRRILDGYNNPAAIPRGDQSWSNFFLDSVQIISTIIVLILLACFTTSSCGTADGEKMGTWNAIPSDVMQS